MRPEKSCMQTTATLKDRAKKHAHGEENEQFEYIDLKLEDVNTGGTNPQKNCSFGESHLMSVLISSSGSGAPRVTELNNVLAEQTNCETERKGDSVAVENAEDVKESPPVHLSPSDSYLRAKCLKSGDPRVITHDAVTIEDKNKPKDEQTRFSDNYFSGDNESDDYDEDDDVVLLLSDECVACVTEDETHYITTHEIQLSEHSDHESDLGLGSSTSWEIEDDNQVYSFVDYASFDGDGAARERGDCSQTPAQGKAAAVITLHESDLRDSAKFTSSDESGSKPPQQQQCGGTTDGQIHLSIRTTSRAINEASNIKEQEKNLYHTTHSGDANRYVFRGVDGKAETLCDSKKCFIASPGRLHFGRKLRGKEVTEYSSGASSAVSDLDDADKEVRNLTARAFKSLAYPYFEAFNLGTSSESSESEHGVGLNRRSAIVDLKYGNMNVSQGLEQRVVPHQNSMAPSQTVDSGYKGISPPTNKIFSLNANPHSTASSTKKIELMGEFSEGHSGVIRLTETLNFRCNMKSGMDGGEKSANFTQNAAGSRSTDEVTNTFLSSQGRGARQLPSKTMEDSHKKAIFASSLIKNVISKKMQFEQERKMERGEIREPHQKPSSPCVAHQDSDSLKEKGSKELQKESSKVSESKSDIIMCVDESGVIVDSGSRDSQRQDGTETKSEPENEAGIDPKKGALEASKSSLHRSQNSAFRCWKDEELEFQKDHKNEQTPEDTTPSAEDREGEEDRWRCSPCSGKTTKMTHLFVPSIQLLSSEEEQQLQGRSHSSCGDSEVKELRSDNTLYVTDARSLSTSKSPEIKINLRSIRNNKTEPFGVSKLRTPNIGCNSSSLRTDDFKCLALAAALKGESSDKVPHFTVRDIRDNSNKGKLQTPIHQVRDVRKLVKSSYHFVSIDNNEIKSNVDSNSEQKKQIPYRDPKSVSPIVIKCQSVNTHSNGKQCENLDEPSDQESPCHLNVSSPEGENAPLQKTAARNPTSPEGDIGLRAENMIAAKRLEKTSDVSDKKADSNMTNQVALEKLQAAVKTMEQLYVFERNEWKRKTDPRPLTDSHVLSLITSEENDGTEEEGARASSVEKTPLAVVASPGTNVLLKREEKPSQSAGSRNEKLVAKVGNNNMVSLSCSSTLAKMDWQNTITQAPFSTKSFAPKLHTPLKNSQTKPSGSEGTESMDSERSMNTSADNENYLTIPVKPQVSSNKQDSSLDKTSLYTFTTQTHPTTPSGPVGSTTQMGQQDPSMSPKHYSIVTETRTPEIPSATIYHPLPLGLPTNQPQVYCFSPAITPSPTFDPFQATQRKMLLDPTTGNYYLVDTPVQPATKRLFDPETGQYVDVPMPQHAPTPVPMPISPLALCPGAYGHTYMIYPGFMPLPSVIPDRTQVQSQMSVQSEAMSEGKGSSQQSEGVYMESPAYMTTGHSPQAASAAAATRPLQGFSNIKQPVISITSQQGPRIIAPPSFDGTTMSFMVEHR